MTPAFTTVIDALHYWERQSDRTPLRQALTPPCDDINDEVYSLGLAVVFRDLVALDTLIERLGRIDAAIQVNEPMVRYCRERGGEEHARRIEAVILVLNIWSAELIAAAEARAA